MALGVKAYYAFSCQYIDSEDDENLFETILMPLKKSLGYVASNYIVWKVNFDDALLWIVNHEFSLILYL